MQRVEGPCLSGASAYPHDTAGSSLLGLRGQQLLDLQRDLRRWRISTVVVADKQLSLSILTALRVRRVPTAPPCAPCPVRGMIRQRGLANGTHCCRAPGSTTSAAMATWRPRPRAISLKIDPNVHFARRVQAVVSSWRRNKAAPRTALPVNDARFNQPCERRQPLCG
jgi:hypothetical protein